MIAAYKVTKDTRHSRVLDDITLTLNSGEFSVLFGPSGSGKSTLCRTLALIDLPDKGIINLLGKEYVFPAANVNINPPYPQVGYVYQQLYLWPHLTNGQNIYLPLDTIESADEGYINYLVDFFDIKALMSRYPNECSVGQKQRIAIIRALALKPKYVFFDEITSALDRIQSKKIVDLIVDLRSQEIGVALVTHQLDLVANKADKFIFLFQGRIVEFGTRSILFEPDSNQLKDFMA